MRMNHASMYARVLANDASCNGRFFTGVLTTGIYCLPACRARKPRAENVQFFSTCEAARAAGLRPCKKCHPDDFARGADPVLTDIESLAAQVRHTPADFPDVSSLVRRSGFGTTRLFELFRLHFQRTPADFLLRARLDFAKERLASTQDGLLAIATDAGFASASVFHAQFRRTNGLTPGAYRALEHGKSFAVHLPPGYATDYLRRALGRDPHSLNERLEGDCYEAAVRLAGTPALLRLSLSSASVDVEFSHGSAREAHRLVVGLLGLEQDTAALVRLARKLGLHRLVNGREGLHLAQTPSLYDAVLWAIIGQQINLPFACLLKRRLMALLGTPVAKGLLAPPTPEEVAALDPSVLLPLQFSRQKAEYVVSVSRLIADRTLDLERLPALSFTRAERTLLAIRGLGPWSVNYILMRGAGLPDCVPLGDTGVTAGLQTLLQLAERPNLETTRRLLAGFSPYRSLATAHLWQINHPLPS